MDDQSLWKKELSFGRKPEDGEDGNESPAGDKEQASMWRKEVSLNPEPQADAVAGDVAANAPVDEPAVEAPAAVEATVDEEKVWKKEVSFSRTPEAEPAVDQSGDETPIPEEEPAAGEQVVAHEPVAVEPEVAEEILWKREISLGPGASSEEESLEAEPIVAEATEPAPEEQTWTREVSFSRTLDAEPAAAQSADEPPVAEEAPVADQAEVAQNFEGAETIASVEPEPWAAPPSLPPAPFPEAPTAIVPLPTPPVENDAPVVADELPLPTGDVPKVPFWKKELSLSGKKRDKPGKEPPAAIVSVLTPSADLHPPVAAADLPPLPDAPRVPFWKKELSLGGKKRDKPVNEDLTAIVPVPVSPGEVHPPVAAADLPPLADDAPKVPFWKKELSVGGKKADKPAKERKQKTAKVKAERAPKAEEPKQPKEPKERKQKAPKVKVERGSGKGRIVGLKIGASQLAAARVSNNGSAELLQVAREPLAPGIVVGGELRDPEALAEALKGFFAKHGLPKKGVRLGIANNRIGVRTFEIAGIEDQKQLANAIRFRAQETLPIPIDEAVLDYQVLGEGVGEDGQPTKRVLLVVAYRELIDRYVDACKKAGITLVGIDLEAFALLRALQAPQEGVGTDATAALVVVAIGHERSTFAVSDGRVCEFTRVLEWGGSALNVAIARAVDAAPSEVEGAKRALALTDEMVPEGLTADQAKNARESMRRAIQTFARELVSSLQYYQNQPGSLGIGEIVLTGGTAHLPGLSGELERLIGVHVRVGDPLARMKVSKKVGQPEQIGSLAVAIGLGIED